MAFVATMLPSEPRSFSIGPYKMQLFYYDVTSGDTSGTITATSLTRAMFVMLDGAIHHSADPTFSGNVVSITFTNPAVNKHGFGFVLGV